jgi:thiosulfate dehydrogenase (quinone) large subunit
MRPLHKTWIFLLRISMGWLFFYAGITKIVNPEWSAAGYLRGAKTFAGFFTALTSPGVLPVVNFLNEWGLTLIGAALILGVAVRVAGSFGALIMLLYYLPILDFPYAGEHSFIVDDHIIYALALLVLGVIKAGRAWGLSEWLSSRFPKCRAWLE